MGQNQYQIGTVCLMRFPCSLDENVPMFVLLNNAVFYYHSSFRKRKLSVSQSDKFRIWHQGDTTRTPNFKHCSVIWKRVMEFLYWFSVLHRIAKREFVNLKFATPVVVHKSVVAG